MSLAAKIEDWRAWPMLICSRVLYRLSSGYSVDTGGTDWMAIISSAHLVASCSVQHHFRSTAQAALAPGSTGSKGHHTEIARHLQWSWR